MLPDIPAKSFMQMQLHHSSLFSFLYKIAVQAQLQCNDVCWEVEKVSGKEDKTQLQCIVKGSKNQQLSTTQKLKVLQQLLAVNPHRRAGEKTWERSY